MIALMKMATMTPMTRLVSMSVMGAIIAVTHQVLTPSLLEQMVMEATHLSTFLTTPLARIPFLWLKCCLEVPTAVQP
jgi:hypothetical protein